MNTVFEKKKIRLIVKSPIHIGSVEQKLTPFEYIHNGQYVYHISEERLADFLQKKNLIDVYISAIDREGHRFRLLDFFSQNGINLKESELVTLSGGRKTKVFSNTARFTEYRPFIRDGFSKVYIPGTSLKGVIRTAILYNALLDCKTQKPKDFENEIVERINNTAPKDFKKKRQFIWLQEDYLESFILEDKKSSPNTDWLRMLHVSDAYPTNTVETILIPLNVIKKESTGWQIKKLMPGQDMFIWVECIPENSILEFNLTWDKRLLEEFKKKNNKIPLPQNLDETASDINKWSNDVLQFEKTFLKGHSAENWYQNTKANFRIGFGSGMTATTIAILLPDDLRKKIRNLAGKNKGNDIAPKSRRVWLKNNQPVPLGWAVMEIISG